MNAKRFATAAGAMLVSVSIFTGVAQAGGTVSALNFSAVPGAKVVADYNLPHDGNAHLDGMYSAYTPEQAKADLNEAKKAPAKPVSKGQLKRIKKAAMRSCKSQARDAAAGTMVFSNSGKGEFVPGKAWSKKQVRQCQEREMRNGRKAASNQGLARAQMCLDAISTKRDYDTSGVTGDPRFVLPNGRYTDHALKVQVELESFSSDTSACPWGGKVLVPFVSYSAKGQEILSQATREQYVTATESFVIPQGVPNQDGDWIAAGASPQSRAAWLKKFYPHISAGQLTNLSSQTRVQLRRSSHPDVVVVIEVQRSGDPSRTPEVVYGFRSVLDELSTGFGGWQLEDSSHMAAIWTHEGEIPTDGWHGGVPDKAMFGYILDADGRPLPFDELELLMY